MKKKDLVIIIPGVRTRKASSNFLKKIEFVFYSLFQRTDPVFSNYGKNWSEEIRKKGKETMLLHWSEGLFILSKLKAVRKLKKIINEYKNTHNIKLLGLSIGGEIAMEAAEDFDDGSIKKIVLLASLNEHSSLKLKNIEIINFYSPQDLFLKVVIRVLSPLKGGMKLNGKNVTNISIPHLDHDDFCDNRKISSGKYKGKRMIDVINKLI